MVQGENNIHGSTRLLPTPYGGNTPACYIADIHDVVTIIRAFLSGQCYVRAFLNDTDCIESKTAYLNVLEIYASTKCCYTFKAVGGYFIKQTNQSVGRVRTIAYRPAYNTQAPASRSSTMGPP